MEAIIRRNVQKAASGDAKSFSTLIALAREYQTLVPDLFLQLHKAGAGSTN
jgi:hypothetical protein